MRFIKYLVWCWKHGAECTICKEFTPGKMKNRDGVCPFCVYDLEEGNSPN